MLLRVSACGGLFWLKDELIWDDYLGHRQFKLVDGTERVLQWFKSWRELASLSELGEAVPATERLTTLAEQMLKLEILVSEGSARHAQEEEILRQWSDWGVSARAFHFGTRSLRGTPYVTAERSNAWLREKIIEEPPPPVTKSYTSGARTSLPASPAGNWGQDSLLDVVTRRRTNRTYGEEPISLASLGALLEVAARPVTPDSRPEVPGSGNVFKTSPSGGSRHPTELYVFARNVDGLARGIYHYDMLDHGLTALGRSATDAELVELTGGQEWVAGAGALIIYTSMIERSQWKYPISRAYRVILMDVGHLSQTVYLLATALNLHVAFTAALRDELVEDLLGCDPARELVVGLSVLGSPSA